MARTGPSVALTAAGLSSDSDEDAPSDGAAADESCGVVEACMKEEATHMRRMSTRLTARSAGNNKRRAVLAF